LAIITMQMMPATSCNQRFTGVIDGAESSDVDMWAASSTDAG
jgi:hypothetical protein